MIRVDEKVCGRVVESVDCLVCALDASTVVARVECWVDYWDDEKDDQWVGLMDASTAEYSAVR